MKLANNNVTKLDQLGEINYLKPSKKWSKIYGTGTNGRQGKSTSSYRDFNIEGSGSSRDSKVVYYYCGLAGYTKSSCKYNFFM